MTPRYKFTYDPRMDTKDKLESPPFVPGMFEDMSGEIYHAIEAISASGAKKILQSPAHYRLARDTKVEPTGAMRFGTAVHTLVLEPQRASEIVEIPDFNRRTNAGREALAEWSAANADRQAFVHEEYERLIATAEAVRQHPAASELFTDGKQEVSLLWTDSAYRVSCKSRFDWLRDDGVIIDLKTCQDASPDAVSRTIANYLYNVQAAFYWCAHEALLDRSPEFFAFVFVETSPPHAVACYALQAEALRAGMRQVEVALRRYKECIDAGVWPGYSDQIQPISVPRWALMFQA